MIYYRKSKKNRKKLIGYSNISSVFLVKSLKELKVNGNLAFIMPFEFFNTGMGKKLRKVSFENHLLKQIIIFSNEKKFFQMQRQRSVCFFVKMTEKMKL